MPASIYLEKLVNISAFPNQDDENQPLIRTVRGGKDREEKYRRDTYNFSVLESFATCYKCPMVLCGVIAKCEHFVLLPSYGYICDLL